MKEMKEKLKTIKEIKNKITKERNRNQKILENDQKICQQIKEFEKQGIILPENQNNRKREKHVKHIARYIHNLMLTSKKCLKVRQKLGTRKNLNI